jgi:diguanylate cyclase (GGDEF)-like protein
MPRKARALIKVQITVQLVAFLAALVYCIWAGAPVLKDYWYPALLLLVAEAATEVTPFTVLRSGTRMQYDAAAMIVVASAILLPTSVGTLVVTAGILVGVVMKREGVVVSVYNLSITAFSVFLCLNVAHFIGPVGLTPRTILGAGVGSILCDASSLALVALLSKLSGKGRFWTFYAQGVVTTAIFEPWVISIGVLLGAIGWAIPWALPLTAAPLALVFLSSRARVQATEDRTRLDGLLTATTSILAATSVSGVTDATCDAAATLFEGRDARVDTDDGGAGELSARLTSELAGIQYLVVGARDALTYNYTDQERRLLETLASIAASALDKAALHEDVAEQATTDALTGLANRRSFEDQVRATLLGMRASDGSGIIFVDLDRFKQINDEYGHQAGDEVLVEVSSRLCAAVRGGDVVARLGGDEFTILLRGVNSDDDAVIVAERVLTSMRHPITLSSGIDVWTSPSIGIALALQIGLDPVTVLKEADDAMYEAKRAGKDCWRLAEPPAELVG